MANRSYLYSTNIVPGPAAKANGRKLVGIAEWNYDIPLVFKLLISGDTKTCQSSIWTNPQDMALIGDYATGVARLREFLGKVTLPEAQPLVAEAIDFLNQPESQNQYFVLECGEIYDLGDTPFAEQNEALLAQVRHLEPEIDAALQSLVPPPPPVPAAPAGFLARLFGRESEAPPQPQQDPKRSVQALGLGNWSHYLYFDFSAP